MFSFGHLSLLLATLALLGTPAHADEIADLKAELRTLREAENRNTKRISELEEKLTKLAGGAAAHSAKDKAVTGGIEEGTWKLPDSDTSVGLYGFIHLDIYTDAKGRQSADWAADIGSQPVNGANVTDNDTRTGKTNLTARASRLGIKTVTPTDTGTIRTVLEADFNKNPSGSDGVLNNTQFAGNFAFRLRHAYGEIDSNRWKLLAGQTWSTFMNLDSAPETVDFNGHASAAYVRQAMIRYTLKMGEAGDLALAIENPHNAFDGGTAQATPYIDKRPDLIANWMLARPWGSLSVQLLDAEYRYDDGATMFSARGHGHGVGGAYKFTGNDALQLQYTAGKGLGRYLPTTSWHIAVYDGATNAVNLYRSRSALVGWAHAWGDTVRSNLAYGLTRIRDCWDSDFSDGIIDSERMTEAFANVITRVAKNTEWGVEYSWGERETRSWTSGAGATGASYTGERRRIQTSLQFSF